MSDDCNCDKDTGTTIPYASSTSSGLLKSVDWLQFFNKVNSSLTINNYPLTTNISLTAEDLNCVDDNTIGSPNGICPLDSNTKIPLSYIPNGIGMNYKGTWNASTNTPPLTNGNLNDFYIVSVAGNTNISNVTNWNVGDWIIYANYQWKRILSSVTFNTLSGVTITNPINNQQLIYNNNIWSNQDPIISIKTYSMSNRDEFVSTPSFSPICSIKESKFTITIKSTSFSGSTILEGIMFKGDPLSEQLGVPYSEYQNSETYSVSLSHSYDILSLTESVSSSGAYSSSSNITLRCVNATYSSNQTPTYVSGVTKPKYSIYDITTQQNQTGYFYGWLPICLNRKDHSVYLAFSTRGDLYLWNRPMNNNTTWNNSSSITYNITVMKHLITSM